MRKKIATLLVVILCLTLVGCGKGSKKGTESIEPTYTASEEVLKATPTSGVVQLDDVTLNVNLSEKIKDVIDALKNSADKDLYIFSEYNAKMLVSSGSTGSFTIYKNGTEYAYFYYWNNDIETVELADCYLSAVSINPEACSTFWIGGGLNLTPSNFTWDNFEEYVNSCGFKSGDADFSDSMQTCNVQSVYEDTSSGDSFKYLVNITYDKTHDVVNNNSTKTTYYQYCNYTIKFNKDTHECTGVSFDGVSTKGINQISVTVDKTSTDSGNSIPEETTESDTEIIDSTEGTETVEESTEMQK